MAAKYRVGVIASGRIAREHGRDWAECEHTEIAAIADACETGHVACGPHRHYIKTHE